MAAWTYSDWITYSSGSSSRLSRLRSHIQEVADKLKEGNTSTEGKSHDWSFLTDYLKQLRDAETVEVAAAGASSGDRVSFTRARLL